MSHEQRAPAPPDKSPRRDPNTLTVHKLGSRRRKGAICTGTVFVRPTRSACLLHHHVRVEERELFEEIERLVPAAELDAIRP
jgi:hypothetical protein